MKWISVKERLPERGVDVLVCWLEKYGTIGIGYIPTEGDMEICNEVYECSFPEHTFDGSGFTRPSTSVSYWMPLPELPGKEE